jgi:hypothetical protein
MAPSCSCSCHSGNARAGGSSCSVHIEGLGGGGRAGASALVGGPSLSFMLFFARLRPSPRSLELGALDVAVDNVHLAC